MERNPIWKHSTSVLIWGLYPASGFNCPFFVTPACLVGRYMCVGVKSLQLCLTLCDVMDCSPPGSSVHGILQTRTLEWVAISFSNAWKWKVRVKSFSHVWLLATPWTVAYQAPPSMDFPGKSTGVWCHCLLRSYTHYLIYFATFENFPCPLFKSEITGLQLRKQAIWFLWNNAGCVNPADDKLMSE